MSKDRSQQHRRLNVTLAQPRGFCAGVVRAIDIVKLALSTYGAPIYVFHEIVHNRHVVSELEANGAVFVDDVDEVPEGEVIIFSAHGVSRSVEEQAQGRNLKVIDATCPLVTKVHVQGQRYSNQGRTVVIVGHIEHEEVMGTMGSIDGPTVVVSTVEEVENLQVADPNAVAYVTQTTLSIDDTKDVIESLKRKFPDIKGPGLKDICYATQNRQLAVRALAKETDLILVVGARNSSNSNRLRDVAVQAGTAAYLISDETGIDPDWLQGGDRIGVTAGASAPEDLVQRVIEKLGKFGHTDIQTMPGITESTVFRLPEELTSTGGNVRNVGNKRPVNAVEA